MDHFKAMQVFLKVANCGSLTQSRRSPNGLDRQEPAKSGHSALGYKTPKEFAEANSVLGSCGKQKPFPTTPQVD